MRVNLLFGFLGSGKTTLAKHLLAERGMDGKTAVIVNEFGEVGVDGEILRGRNIDVVELNSGCLCCTLRGSLMLAIEELRDKASVERVIVEATGVAQPSELVDSLADSSREGGLDVGPLVTVVDAAKFPKLVSMLGDFYMDQIESADIVIVNKIDLASPEQLREVTREIRELNPEADILFAEQGRVRPEQLFERQASGLVDKALEEAGAAVPGGHGHAQDPGHGHEHAHDHDHEQAHDHDHDPHEGAPAQSFALAGAGNAHRAGVERFFGGLPDEVWRAKGFLRIDGAPCLVQYSAGQLEITPADGAAREAIVFIGRNLDRADIEARFALAAKR
jgi:G3E family GTPase